MPNCGAHLTVSALGSALLTAYGSARFGWDGAAPALAFLAGAAGGLVPDVDCDTSKPRRWAVAAAGLSGAAALAGFGLSAGQFLHRPWSPRATLLAATAAFAAFFLAAELGLRHFTRHRGLWHSLAVPFLYSGLLACLATARSGDTAMAVWLLGLFGVFSHLLLDAAWGLTLGPLKPATADTGASLRLWLATLAVTLAAFARLTRV